MTDLGVVAKETEVSAVLQENIVQLDYLLVDCPDIIKKKARLKDDSEVCFYLVEDLCDIDLTQRDFIQPILNKTQKDLLPAFIEELPLFNISSETSLTTLVKSLLSGDIIFLAEGCSFGISCSIKKVEKRAIVEPEVEKNVRGSHEGFIEVMSTNVAILRRRIKNTNLKFKKIKLGTTTNQTVMIAYINGIADPELLDELYKRISAIDFDGLMGIGYIEQFICDSKNSIFPQLQTTERPDKVIAALLEGRFAIMLEGTPVALIAPVSFFSLFQAVDDYTTNWIFGSFIRLIRFIGAAVAVFTPGLYIAITQFHYYMVPLNLLIPLAESRSRVPFPPVVEALIMEITIEMIREASIRLPTFIGSTIGVIGGIVIGQAAVEAGIVSSLLLIVVSVTGIASYVVPNYDVGYSIRIVRFGIVLAASIFGVIGVIISLMIIAMHLVSLESLGKPYFQPVQPFKPGSIKDSFIRAPLKYLSQRADMPHPIDKKRGKKDE
jgi:spore germination protein